ncbi:arsenic resistance protein [Luteimonas yindakuii]|uniref:arsenic resistance protein n=1 Tax=Luteimonas yindakuii TaxID=2565782 RepID=UPI0010A513E4|nr:arsenic resistance protein [Luteimonas yindakuii]QCO67034.1 arsenic resistance protein [Luteimonas yindakuii]
MTRLQLERHQVWIYLAAIAGGLVLGTSHAGRRDAFELLLWPALVVLLYATFVQVPLLQLREAFADRRFLVAVVTGNFALVPLLVFAMLQLLPADPALRLGVALVLLVPCTDWFIGFAQMGGGDTSRAIAVTPLNLVLQLLLLPLYLWWLPGAWRSDGLPAASVVPAVLVVLVPLVAAAITARWVDARSTRAWLRERLAWWPVPLLALVVLLVAASQVATVRAALDVLPVVVPLFAGYLVAAAMIAKVLGSGFRLPARHGRTLCFSLGTRNSFVVLPLALALPDGWAVAAVVIVTQSLVELLGMLAYLRWVPRLFPD